MRLTRARLIWQIDRTIERRRNCLSHSAVRGRKGAMIVTGASKNAGVSAVSRVLITSKAVQNPWTFPMPMIQAQPFAVAIPSRWLQVRWQVFQGWVSQMMLRIPPLHRATQIARKGWANKECIANMISALMNHLLKMRKAGNEYLLHLFVIFLGLWPTCQAKTSSRGQDFCDCSIRYKRQAWSALEPVLERIAEDCFDSSTNKLLSTIYYDVLFSQISLFTFSKIDSICAHVGSSIAESIQLATTNKLKYSMLPLIIVKKATYNKLKQILPWLTWHQYTKSSTKINK